MTWRWTYCLAQPQSRAMSLIDGIRVGSDIEPAECQSGAHPVIMKNYMKPMTLEEAIKEIEEEINRTQVDMEFHFRESTYENIRAFAMRTRLESLKYSLRKIKGEKPAN